uniref:Nucleoprotein n=1 Tax=Phytophthora palustris bunya-like virus 11 TaxID=2976276 RepID=A0A9E9C4J8_9VIRU|nr:nucleoprotein [Phytophthora palustris bunya-like virus 11]
MSTSIETVTETWTLENAIEEFALAEEDLTCTSAFEYQGFDPVKTFEKLRGIAAEAKWTKGQFMSRVTQAIILYLMRGTSMKTKKMSEDGVQLMRTLRQDLRLVIKPTKVDDVSLHRIASLFPRQVMLILQSGKVQPSVTTETLPSYLSFPQAPALMKRDSPMRAGWISWYRLFSDTINSGTRGYQQMSLEEAERWFELYRSKSLIHEDKRDIFTSAKTGEKKSTKTKKEK